MFKNFRKYIIISATLLSVSAFADSYIVGEFNNNKVTIDQMQKYIDQKFASDPTIKSKKFSDLDKELREKLVDSFIKEHLIESEVAKSNVQNTPAFKERLNFLQQNLKRQIYIEQLINSSVTETKIKAEYDKYKNSFKDKKEFKVAHILVDTSEKAENIYSKIQKGADFESLAKEFSLDNNSSKNGGRIDQYLQEGQVVPEFEKTVKTMNKSEISKPVKTNFGFHIIRLDEVRDATIPKYEDVKDKIKNSLSAAVIENYLENLLKKANAKIYVK